MNIFHNFPHLQLFQYCSICLVPHYLFFGQDGHFSEQTNDFSADEILSPEIPFKVNNVPYGAHVIVLGKNNSIVKSRSI